MPSSAYFRDSSPSWGELLRSYISLHMLQFLGDKVLLAFSGGTVVGAMFLASEAMFF